MSKPAPHTLLLGVLLALSSTISFAATCESHDVTITRDDWGIAHVRGRTDADAVFGMMYAQAEDDFNRIETNYLVSLGRLAEAEGESALWQDLRQRLFIDSDTLQADFGKSPDWLKKLMRAWAAGLNCYLATHPQVRPRVITRFEPWMALSFSEGSIGGDIERVPLSQLEAFYGGKRSSMTAGERGLLFREPQGSNGFAIAPSHTKNGHALLLINPHTSFFFRSELQVTSSEGLNVYGAATWGQFFIYQGFNEQAGWMHTSSGADNVDEFAETVVTDAGGKHSYRYGKELRSVDTRVVTLSYRAASGKLAQRSFTTYATHHGPIVREEKGKWIAFALMNEPVAALQQSFLRTKSSDYASFLDVAKLKANSSNNTLFADSKGTVAYLHPQFMPIRNDRYDYRNPVDGSDPATDWQGLHELDGLPHVVAPANGWVMNVNNWPWTAAGADSPKAANFPRYMDQDGENPRGPQAQRVLGARKDFTLQTLLTAAFDSYLTAFARLTPLVLAAYDALPQDDPARAKLAGPVDLLRGWDYRWSLDSKPTSLAVFFGEALWSVAAEPAQAAGLSKWDYMADRTTPAQKLASLTQAVDRLTQDFGSWQVPWGEINRFQRNDGAIVQTFDDAKPSTPVPFASAEWGSLASFGAKRYPGTRRYYGTRGNSFVAAVEFGTSVRALAVSIGGASGHPESKHFVDQVQRYANGDLRPVYFYPKDLEGHIERSYRPGEKVAAGPLTIARLVDQPTITGTAPSAVSWSSDNRHLAFLWNDAGLPSREIWIVSGEGTQLRSFTTPTTPAQGVSEFAWTPDSSSIVFLRGADVWRKTVTAGSDHPSERLATIGSGGANNLAVSPDGTYASFLKDGDLWLLRLATGELKQATRVGVPSIASVPYGEYNRPDVEIGPYIWGSPTYAWSPDSRTIAVHYVDRRGLRKVPFPYYLGEETQANTIRRNYPGDPNESRTIGFLDVASGELKLLDLPEQAANRIVDFSWSGNGALLLDRESDTAVDRWVEIVDARSGKRREVWHDSRDTRIYNSIGAAWHADGKRILMRGDLADRYGLYLLRPGSKQPKLLTDERFDVTDGPYLAGRAIYYQSNEPSPYERHVYRIPAQGGKATRITTLGGDNQPFPSPDGNKVAILHSDDVTPTDLYLTDARGAGMRRITTSPPAEFAARAWAPARYVTFPSNVDKHTLHARILTPPDLDPNKTYPVIFGPVYSNTVRNRWVAGLYGTLQQLLVERGYIVVQVDVRGSTGYGRAFREEFLADFAGKDLEDLQSAVAYLKTLPYVDPERLGIWGSSYGGTLTVYSLLKKPGLFKAGVAGAAAVDPHFFGNDDVAIVRRPGSRPDAFERGAAQYAANLQDHLLIIHGMQDNVVPFKTTVALAEELMRQGKDFDFAFAPAAMHRWPSEPHYARYLLGKLVAHFDRYLGPGGKERATASASRD